MMAGSRALAEREWYAEVGRRLNARRREAGLSRRRLAGYIGIDASALQRRIQGLCKTTWSDYLALCQLIGPVELPPLPPELRKGPADLRTRGTTT
jgi:transcriptional regulator with XRE-family HTH domain